MTLPKDHKKRKDTPIYSGVVRYFPDALAAVAECSKAGNDQHHPGKPLQWDRSKSTDELDALQRHLVEAGTLDSDGIRHSAKIAWRALANLQKEIENSETLHSVAAEKAIVAEDIILIELRKHLPQIVELIDAARVWSVHYTGLGGNEFSSSWSRLRLCDAIEALV